MKTKVTLIILAVVTASCSSLQQSSVYDDLYYSPKDQYVASNEGMAYVSENPNYDDGFYDKLDREIEDVLQDTAAADDTVLFKSSGNPYTDILMDDPYEARKMRELAYYDPSSGIYNSTVFVSDAYWYASAYDPAFYNVIVCGGYVWVEPKWISATMGHSYGVHYYNPHNYWYGSHYGYHGSYYHYGYGHYNPYYPNYYYPYYMNYYYYTYGGNYNRREFAEMNEFRSQRYQRRPLTNNVSGTYIGSTGRSQGRTSVTSTRPQRSSASVPSRTTGRVQTIRRTDISDSRSDGQISSRVATRDRSSISKVSDRTTTNVRSMPDSRSTQGTSSYVKSSASRYTSPVRSSSTNRSQGISKSSSSSSRYSRPSGTSTYSPGRSAVSRSSSSSSRSSSGSVSRSSTSRSSSSSSYRSSGSSSSSRSSSSSSSSSSRSSSGSSRGGKR